MGININKRLRLYLDDVRTPLAEDWVIVRNYEHFVSTIRLYGLENFEFEVVACCKTQDNANELETLLVMQYDSFIKNGKGKLAWHYLERLQLLCGGKWTPA